VLCEVFIQRLIYKKIEMGYANVTLKSVVMQIAQLAQTDSFSTFVRRILKKISLILFILHWLYLSSQVALTRRQRLNGKSWFKRYESYIGRILYLKNQ
jgi:hypothetical protein